MKKMFLFLLFAVIGITAFCVNDTVVSENEVVVNLTGNTIKDFLINNWAAFASIILVLIWEHFLGETSKIKSNSTIRLVYSWLSNFLKKKAGKVIIIAAVFGCSVVGLNAQTGSPWKGFFKPVAQNENFKTLKADASGTVTSSTKTDAFLFRPSVTVTGVLFDLKTKETQTLTGAGVGISYGSYTVTNGSSYCNYSFNASLLTSVKINDETTANFGAAASIDVFNKVVGLLVGYLGTSGFANGHMVIGTTFSYSF